MRRTGQNIYLTKSESTALLRNDLHPNEEAQRRRRQFLEEIEKTVKNVHFAPCGGLTAQAVEIEEEVIAETLNKKENLQTQYHFSFAFPERALKYRGRCAQDYFAVQGNPVYYMEGSLV